MDSRQFVVLNDRPRTPVQPKAMQRQGLVQPFRQTAGRRLVPVVQLALERRKGRAGLGVSPHGRRAGGAGRRCER